MPDYEVDFERGYENGHHTLIAILTGLPIADILEHAPAKPKWNGRTYIELFRKLGFNVNPKFKKFDPNTAYPCMMRYYRNDIKEPYWYADIYYKQKVYTGYGDIYEFDEWVKFNAEFRVTSMLQVWI